MAKALGPLRMISWVSDSSPAENISSTTPISAI